MTHFLRGLAGGRVILCLEGGYNITSISYSMTMCTKALLGDPLLHHYDHKATCHWSAVESINNVIKTHKKYWKNLKFQLALPIEPVIEEPLPSIGLIIMEDQNSTIDSDRLSEASSSTLESPKSNASESTNDLNYSLDGNMAALSIRPKCSDGLHCGTDDEENGTDDGLKREAKKQRTDLECYKIDRTIIDKDLSSPNQGASSSNQISSNSNQGASTSSQGRLRDVSSNTNHRSPIENVSRSSATQALQSNTSGSSASQGVLSTVRGEVSSTKQASSSINQSGSIATYDDKQTLVGYLAENMQAIVDGEMFAVIPQTWCPHLDSLFAIPSHVKFAQGIKCVDCEETVENWVCLHCFIVSI